MSKLHLLELPINKNNTKMSTMQVIYVGPISHFYLFFHNNCELH